MRKVVNWGMKAACRWEQIPWRIVVPLMEDVLGGWVFELESELESELGEVASPLFVNSSETQGDIAK